VFLEISAMMFDDRYYYIYISGNIYIYGNITRYDNDNDDHGDV
jgi:hypothetical protein